MPLLLPLRLPGPLAAELAALARAAYPAEACALLVGNSLRIMRIVAGRNVADDPARQFEFDPATQIALRRELRAHPEQGRLLGHWHSHPDGADAPSATDAAMIHEPELLWLISRVTAADAGQPRGFRPRPDGSGFDEIPVEIT